MLYSHHKLNFNTVLGMVAIEMAFVNHLHVQKTPENIAFFRKWIEVKSTKSVPET
jgi:hypothetical protein